MINVVDMQMTVGMLEQAMKLPANVKIVGISNIDSNKLISVRFATETEPSITVPECCGVSNISEIGNVFVEPDKYKQSIKGEMRGCPN